MQKKDGLTTQIRRTTLATTKEDGTCFYESIARILLNDAGKYNANIRNLVRKLQDVSRHELDVREQWESYMFGPLSFEGDESDVGKGFSFFRDDALRQQGQTDFHNWILDSLVREYELFISDPRKRTKSGTEQFYKNKLFRAFQKYIKARKVYADEYNIRKLLDHDFIKKHFIIMIILLRFWPDESNPFTLETEYSKNFFECHSAKELQETSEKLCRENPGKRVAILVRVQGESKKGANIGEETRLDVHYQPVVFHVNGTIPPELSKPICRLCDDNLLSRVVQGYMTQCVHSKGVDPYSAAVAINQHVPERDRKSSPIRLPPLLGIHTTLPEPEWRTKKRQIEDVEPLEPRTHGRVIRGYIEVSTDDESV